MFRRLIRQRLKGTATDDEIIRIIIESNTDKRNARRLVDDYIHHMQRKGYLMDYDAKHAMSLAMFCPNCQAKPGEACTQPTEFSRKAVTWFHAARVAAVDELEDQS
jgi:hypothetical protein